MHINPCRLRWHYYLKSLKTIFKNIEFKHHKLIKVLIIWEQYIYLRPKSARYKLAQAQFGTELCFNPSLSQMHTGDATVRMVHLLPFHFPMILLQLTGQYAGGRWVFPPLVSLMSEVMHKWSNPSVACSVGIVIMLCLYGVHEGSLPPFLPLHTAERQAIICSLFICKLQLQLIGFLYIW